MIKRKRKKCRGTKKAVGSGCKEEHYLVRFGLCKECYKKWLFTTKEGQIYLRKNTIKVQQKRISQQKSLQEAQESRTKRKKLRSVILDTKNVVHEAVRLRDKGKKCISCGCDWNENFDAGHFYKAELYSALKFDFDNIHGQCMRCNRHKEGNLNKYEENLIKKLGSKKFEELKARKQKYMHENFKWDIEEIKKIRSEARKYLKKLKNNE